MSGKFGPTDRGQGDLYCCIVKIVERVLSDLSLKISRA